MKKSQLFLAAAIVVIGVFLIMFFNAPKETPSKPEAIKDVSCSVSVKYMEAAPGYAYQIKKYTFKGKVLSCSNDTVSIEAQSSSSQAKIAIAIPSSKKFSTGTPVNVIAEAWSGAYERGLVYDVQQN